MRRIPPIFTGCLPALLLFLAVARPLPAQSTSPSTSPFTSSSIGALPPAPTAAPAAPAITLDQAIAAALHNDPAYAAASAASGSARLDTALARAALLPSADAHGEYLYTQPNGVLNQAGQTGSQAAPRFIANNAIREYAAQVLVSETVSLAGLADYRRSRALALQASADLESARRDLVLRVVGAYFGVLSSADKAAVASRALQQAEAFLDLTRKLESGREVAHADVVKADLQAQQRQREAEDAGLAARRARLDLGVLLFPDPRTPYTLAAQDQLPPPLQARPVIEAAAARNNPDLRSALASLQAARQEVAAARAAYFPTLGFNYTWGIDAPQVAVYGPDGVRNLGYSASASIDVPLWNWFATHDRVRQSQLHATAAQAALTSMQRTLIAQLDEFYSEAVTADHQVASLRASADTARESLRLTRLRYQAGEALALEVVDAQNSLAQAEAAVADGLLRSRIARANLQTLTGVL